MVTAMYEFLLPVMMARVCPNHGEPTCQSSSHRPPKHDHDVVQIRRANFVSKLEQLKDPSYVRTTQRWTVCGCSISRR
jgi:hypothetical protein